MTQPQTLSADQVADALVAAGHDPAAVAATAGEYAAAKYAPKGRKLIPRFEVLSDAEADFGTERHQLRRLNPHDIKRLVPVVKNAVIAVMRDYELEEDLDQIMTNAGPKGVFNLLAGALQDTIETCDPDEYPEWAVALLEEIARCVSTNARTVTAADLISLPDEQLPALLVTLWEVSAKNFLSVFRRVWGLLPELARKIIDSKIFTPVLMILNELSLPAESSPSPSETASSGGPLSGGNPSSSSPAESTGA